MDAELRKFRKFRIFKKVFYIWPKTNTIENLFIYLGICSDLLPVFAFLFFYSRLKNDKVTKILIGFLLFDFFINLALLYYWIPYKYHNKTYPVFTLIETILFACFFFRVMKTKAAKKSVPIITLLVSIGFLVYYYYNYFAFPKKMPLDSVPIGIETILMFSFVGIYLYQEMNDTESLFIYNKPQFWGVIGIMIYLALSFFVYIFANQISIKELGKFWIITNIACIIRNVFFCRQLFLQNRQKDKNNKKRVSYKLSTAN